MGYQLVCMETSRFCGDGKMTILEYIGLVPIVAAIVVVVGYCISRVMK